MKPPPLSPSPPASAPAARRLLDWFDGHRRDLPWRRTRSPYRIWVSEVMLQQTRVETVIPYYERFVDRFPTLADLAAASEEEVLAAWSGLGYYRRARHLREAARRLVAGGQELPRTAAELRRLPGFGPYTAAAVASIAFGDVVPVIDGNVIRVACRLTAESGDPKRAAVRRRLEEVAAGLLEAARPGDSNQAMMELGATLCSPRSPECGHCPLQPDCAAESAGSQEDFPVRRAPRPVTRIQRTVVVVEDRGAFLLFRRAAERAVLAGTWELPFADGDLSVAELERALEERYAGRWTLGERVGELRHAITHRSFLVEVRTARRRAGGEVREGPEARWSRRSELNDLPHSSLVGKALGLYADGGSAGPPPGRDLEPGIR